MISDILYERLGLIFNWYKGMVNEKTGRLQCVQVCTERERGGFGFSLSDRTQRIDVTGHFVNGMIKSLSNGVVC